MEVSSVNISDSVGPSRTETVQYSAASGNTVELQNSQKIKIGLEEAPNMQVYIDDSVGSVT